MRGGMVFGAVISCVIACSVVAGLGPEAHVVLRNPCAGFSANIDRCSLCVGVYCCVEAQTCAADPLCTKQKDCLTSCAYQFECTSQCTPTAPVPNFDALTQCSVDHCIAAGECLPGPACDELGACCIHVGDSTVQHACVGITSRLDEGLCEANLSRFCGYVDAAGTMSSDR